MGLLPVYILPVPFSQLFPSSDCMISQHLSSHRECKVNTSGVRVDLVYSWGPWPLALCVVSGLLAHRLSASVLMHRGLPVELWLRGDTGRCVLEREYFGSSVEDGLENVRPFRETS